MSEKVVLLVLYNKEEIIMQKRKRFINKKTEYDFGFFGGHIEKGERVGEALKREIKEELSLNVENIKSLRFFKKYKFNFEDKGISVELSVYLCDIKEVEKRVVREGKDIKVNFSEAEKLEGLDNFEKNVLKEIRLEVAK